MILCDGLTCDDGGGRYEAAVYTVDAGVVYLFGFFESLAGLRTMTVGATGSKGLAVVVVDRTWKCGPGRWWLDVVVVVDGVDP